MSKSNHTEAQMIGALKQLEAGRKAEDVAREVGVSKVSVRATHLVEDSTSDFKRARVFRLRRYENPASVGYKCNVH